MAHAEYRFSVGPWNLGRGADPFGPPVRPAVPFADVLRTAVDLGFHAIQFHDDDAVPDLETMTPAQITKAAESMRKMLADMGLVAEFVAADGVCDHAAALIDEEQLHVPAGRPLAAEGGGQASAGVV